jgi:hypothetical protein
MRMKAGKLLIALTFFCHLAAPATGANACSQMLRNLTSTRTLTGALVVSMGLLTSTLTLKFAGLREAKRQLASETEMRSKKQLTRSERLSSESKQNEILDELVHYNFNRTSNVHFLSEAIKHFYAIHGDAYEAQFESLGSATILHTKIQDAFTFSVIGPKNFSTIRVHEELTMRRRARWIVEVLNKDGDGIAFYVERPTSIPYVKLSPKDLALYARRYGKIKMPEGGSIDSTTLVSSRDSDGAAKRQGTLVAVIDKEYDMMQYDEPYMVRNLGEDRFDSKGFYLGLDGIDNDEDGLPDNTIGFNFRSNHFGPNVGNSSDAHGSHVANFVVNNSENIKVIPFAVGDTDKTSLSSAREVADYKTAFELVEVLKTIYANNRNPSAQKIRVVNISMVFPRTQEIIEGIKMNSDVLFVFSGGNRRSVEFPANVNLSNTVAVGAYDAKTQSLAPWSARSKAKVSVAAPGVDVIDPHKSASRPLSGTSFAAPQVAHAAAQIFEARPELSPTDVKTILEQSASKVPALKQQVRSGGVLNQTAAFELAAKFGTE